MITYDETQAAYLAVAGNTFDIIGAVILSRALMWSRPGHLARQAAASWDMNTKLLRALCEQTLDAKWGVNILGLGFTFQAVSAAGVKMDLISSLLLFISI